MTQIESKDQQPHLLEHLSSSKSTTDAFVCICLMSIIGYLIKRHKNADNIFKQKLQDFVQHCSALMTIINAIDSARRSNDTERPETFSANSDTDNHSTLNKLYSLFNMEIRKPSENKPALRGTYYKSTRQSLVNISSRINAYNGTLMFFNVITNTAQKDINRHLPIPHQEVLKALPKLNR